jgi:hypothetical protein
MTNEGKMALFLTCPTETLPHFALLHFCGRSGSFKSAPFGEDYSGKLSGLLTETERLFDFKLSVCSKKELCDFMMLQS